MAESPRGEYERYRDHLWVEREPLAWRRLGGGYRAIVRVEGAPPEIECSIVVQIPERAWPGGSFSVLWREVRLFGFDLSGPAHRDSRNRLISTPHRQWYEASGREAVEAVDLEHEGIDGWERAWRWFLQWCGIGAAIPWIEPPAQE